MRFQTTGLRSLLFLPLALSLQACTAEQIARTDTIIYDVVEAGTRKDKITGIRELNFDSEEQEKAKARKAIETIKLQAKLENIKIYGPQDPIYKRVQRIYSRVLAVSHYHDETDFELIVLGSQEFNAFALGGGNIIVLEGLVEALNNDELAYIIGHELAHNAAAHIAESEAYTKAKRILSDQSDGFDIAFTNINEQEADRVGILYAALAGFNPLASATVWENIEKKYPTNYSYFRTHPANTERAASNRATARLVESYYAHGKQNNDYQSLLICNSLFCSKTLKKSPGEGGGFEAMGQVLGSLIVKNYLTKQELKKQKSQISLSPPEVNWQGSGWNIKKGTIVRHGQKVGVNFAFQKGQGQFFYNHNGKVEKGSMTYSSVNEHGYWWKWTDAYGGGRAVFNTYTDGSIRGTIYLTDGTDPGRVLGAWIGQ